MSRSKNVINSTIWELGYYIVTISLGFLAPRYIILYYSSEVNGLTTTVQNIITILLLLQAGVVTAAVYSLYKPIADNNYDEICKNIQSSISFIRKIAYIFGGLLLLVAGIAPFLLDTELDKIFVFLAMVIMGTKSFVDIYFTAKYRIIFTAYQQKYYVSMATLIEQVVYYLLVFVTIFARWHYIWLYVWFLLGCVVKIVCLEGMLKRSHPEVCKIKPKRMHSTIGGRSYALANELSHSIMGSSVAISMSVMYGLAVASVYSVYALVNDALNLVTTSLYSSFAPSFGNLCAQEDKKRAAQVFCIFQYIFSMFSTFLMMCMLFSVVPFVRIYTAGAVDIVYENFVLAIIIAVGGLFSAYRVPYNVIVSSCGYFKETWLQPVITVIICVGIAIGLGQIDYTYLPAGVVVFYATNFIYQHFRLKKIVPHMIQRNIFVLFGISAMGLGLTVYINSQFTFPSGVIAWIGCSFVYACLSILYIVIASLFFARAQLVDALRYVMSILKRRR